VDVVDDEDGFAAARGAGGVVFEAWGVGGGVIDVEGAREVKGVIEKWDIVGAQEVEGFIDVCDEAWMSSSILSVVGPTIPSLPI
jgi:hypothetical protein